MRHACLSLLVLLGCVGDVEEGRPDAAEGALVDGVDGGAVHDGGGSALDSGTPSADAGTARPDAGMGPRSVRVEGRRLLVDEVPFEVRAVAWNPVRRGATHPGGLDFRGTVEQDAAMMRAAGFNAVRTYVALTDRVVLDALHRHGLMVLNTVYSFGGEDVSVVNERVRSVAAHPAMLAWLVGNEWNYNGLYVGLSPTASRDRLNAVMERIRAEDTRLPIVNVYGEVPSAEVIAAMPRTDIWALNVYRGATFGNLFTTWASRSPKPMMLGEFGADAWNARLPGVDEAAQAFATEALTRELHRNWSGDGGVAVGGALFEWCDEWWKDGQGRPDRHDVGGIAPGGGPHPDFTFNEEWWGLVDIERRPRQALGAVKRGFGLE
ncbi:MAG: hypothetical protein MUC96_20705 [Myxococcaceae bacterium]|jgi:hypothetical protein|nr:hypothetical protein [Myxococcaceae bacterium]